MGENTENTPMGDLGQARARQTRDRMGRIVARALREGWAPNIEKLDRLREEVENVILNSADDRAKVLAYRALLDSEIAIVNSINQIAALENNANQATEFSDDESGDPENFD